MSAHRRRFLWVAGRFLAAIAACLVLAASFPTAQAQVPAFPRTLDDIRVFGRGETIQFVFSKPYDGTPSVEYAPGRMALTFVGVGSQKPVRDLRPKEESLYREIRVVQNRYSTTVSFLLRDAGQNLKDRISFGRDGNVFNVDIRDAGTAQAPAVEPAVQGQKAAPLLSEMEQKIAGAPAQESVAQPPTIPTKLAAPAVPSAAASTSAIASAPGTPSAPSTGVSGSAPAPAPLGLGGMPDSSFFSTLATMIVALAIMLGGLYGVLYLYKRFVHARLARFAGTPSMRQVASFPIGPRQRIVILEINSEWIACGVTPSQITFLTHLTGAQHGAAQASAAQVSAPDRAADREAPEVRADPVHQFAEVLKQKVRSLKRIN